jgi:hypothetical protein
MRTYRVWHKKDRYTESECEIVAATNGKEAKQKVKAMFPEHKVTTCWLITKGA